MTGVGCCLAQLGSAAMLMGVDLGFLPSNFTTPLSVPVAVSFLVEVGGPPAFTAGWVKMHITTAKVAIRVWLFVVMRTNFLPLAPGIWSFVSSESKLTKGAGKCCHSEVNCPSLSCKSPVTGISMEMAKHEAQVQPLCSDVPAVRFRRTK